MDNWEEYEKEICALYIEIGNIHATAAQAGLSFEKCREILSKHGYFEIRHNPETLEKYRAIAADYESGATLREISDAYSIPYEYTAKLLRGMGYSPVTDTRARRAKQKAARIAAYLSCWYSGMTLKEISEKFNVTLSTAAFYLSHAGVDFRDIWNLPKYIPKGTPTGVPEGERTKEIKQAILNAKERHIPLYEVAKAYGVSRQYITQLADKLDYHPGDDPEKKAAQKAKENAIVEAWNSGLTNKQIAEKFNMLPSTVCTILKKNGVDTKSRAKYRQKRGNS